MLPALVQRTIAAAGTSLSALDAIAVSIGPGSFTGLRVALGLAKGMAFAAGLPLIGVPTLEALALAADAAPGATVWAALDARKQQVYAASFRIDAPLRCTRLSLDEATAPAELAARLDPASVLVGDATTAYPEIFAGRAVIRPFASFPPRGGVVAYCGWDRLQHGDSQNPGDLEPVYVRAPEAVLAMQK